MRGREPQRRGAAGAVAHTAETTGYTICALLLVAVLVVLGACDDVMPAPAVQPEEPKPQPEKDTVPRFKERVEETRIEVVIITIPTLGAPDWIVNCNQTYVNSKPYLPSAIGGNGDLLYSFEPEIPYLWIETSNDGGLRVVIVPWLVILGDYTVTYRVIDADENESDADTDAMLITVRLSSESRSETLGHPDDCA